MSFKVFISHAANDRILALSFTEFLQLSMGLAKEDIYCTSINGTLRTGKEFIPDIKEKLTDCQVVIFLITPEYLKSKFCLAELGAAWALNQNIYPLLASSLDFSCLNDTPLKGIEKSSQKAEALKEEAAQSFPPGTFRKLHATSGQNFLL